MSDIIKITVTDPKSGNKKIFQTTAGTIGRAVYFKSQLPDLSEFEIDMDIECFSNILNYLRGGPKLKDEYADMAKFIINGDQLIKVNIGGEKFVVPYSILNKSLYFSALLPDALKTHNEIFVDRDPEIFKLILIYLKNPTYYFPPEFYYELDYYMINMPLKNTMISMVEKSHSTLTSTNIACQIKANPYIYYNATPQITYNKTIYRRSTQIGFDYEYKQNLIPTIDNIFEYTMTNESNIGFGNIYFAIEFDKIVEDYSNIEWIQNVESFVFEYVEIYANSMLIYKINSESMFVIDRINESGDRIAYDCLPSGHGNGNDYTYRGRGVDKKAKFDTDKLIVPFYHFFNDTNAMFPLIAARNTTFTFKLKLRDLSELIINQNNQEILCNIKSFKPIIKNIILDTEEHNRFLNVNHEYFITTMNDFTIKLKQNILTYEIPLFNISLPSHFYINSLFLYFSKPRSLLPHYENNLFEIVLMVGNKVYCSIDKDLLEKICYIENKHHYNINNIFSYNLGYILTNASNKCMGLMVGPDPIKLIIRMNEGFTANKLTVIVKGEKIMRFLDGNVTMG